MEKRASKQTRIALIVLIVFLLASILSLSFAWFTDKKESTSNITFGNILLDVTGASAGENGELKFNITRNEVTTTTNSKVMPGDIVNINLTVGLKTNSQPAYYLLKVTDKTNKVFKNSFYFSDGTVDGSNNLVVYQTDGTTSWEQNNETKTTTKMVGKISNPNKHNISIKAEISRDYEEENSKTEIICDVYAIQQANLTESEAKNHLLAGVNSDVPLEYTQVEYLKSTGTQYIDTGYIANNNTKVDLEFETTNISKNQALFCSRQTINLTNPTYTLFILSGKLRLDIEKQQYATNIDIAQDTKYHVSVEKGVITVGGNTFNVNNKKEFTTGQSMLMFISNTGVSSGELTGLGNQAYIKMYSFKIYDNNKLVRDFVPCVRNSDGKVGMYDMVTKNFYVNSGTGADFITN